MLTITKSVKIALKKKKIQQMSEKFVYFQKMKVVLISITSVIEETLSGWSPWANTPWAYKTYHHQPDSRAR